MIEEQNETLYDPRKNPKRGVRIKPLPRIVQPAFRRFCAEVRVYAQSQVSTWKLAKREYADLPFVHTNLVYWQSVVKFINHLEYLGTSNDPARHP